jgi:hypothetical protein
MHEPKSYGLRRRSHRDLLSANAFHRQHSLETAALHAKDRRGLVPLPVIQMWRGNISSCRPDRISSQACTDQLLVDAEVLERACV